MQISIKQSVLFLCLFLLLTIHGGVRAQSTNSTYIEESGIWIEGDIYRFYQQVTQPDMIFGLPITSQYIDPLTGTTVQYFQNARLDMVSDDGETMVKVAPLGTLLYEDNGSKAENLPLSGSCRKIGTAGYEICFAFRVFYEQNHGDLLFGEPISPIEVREGRFVQYFENVRLEWQPDHNEGARIACSDLGVKYFNSLVGSVPEENQPGEKAYKTSKVKLHANASVADALLPSNSQQTLYITATDQNRQPIEGVMIGVTVHMPHKDTFYRPPATDTNGISTLTFSVDNVAHDEMVEIDVTSSYQGMEEKSATWFRVWWE